MDDFSDLENARKQIRRQERLSRKEYARMSRLEQELLSKLPASLVPGNVGNFYDVAWPFNYTVLFDFGTNPTYGPLTNQIQSFQNTQEAAFILGAISRKCYSGSTSGELAPLQIAFRDRQSTRQFSDLPLPLQAIAKKTPPTIFEVPYLILPNGFFDTQITCFNPANQATVGSGKISITFHGYRTRTSNIENILSTVYGG